MASHRSQSPTSVASTTPVLIEQHYSHTLESQLPPAPTQALTAPAIFAQAQITADLKEVERVLHERTRSRSYLITAAGMHTVSAGGKRLRAALALLAARLGDYNLARVLPAAAAVEFIHGASLVHDDLVDQAARRRGHVTVHTRWDNDVALMVGDYFFALAAAEMARSPDPRIITYYAEAVQTTVEGELSPVMDVAPFDTALDQYIYKIGCKTAALFEAACKSGMAVSGGSETDIAALGQYGYNLGLAFQVIDDVLDFTGDEHTLGKPAGNDLRQGTITLPLIYAIANGGSVLLREIVDVTEPSDAQVAQAVAEVIACGGVDRALADAELYIQRALAHLERFPASQGQQGLVDLATYVIARET